MVRSCGSLSLLLCTFWVFPCCDECSVCCNGADVVDIKSCAGFKVGVASRWMMVAGVKVASELRLGSGNT